MSDRPSISIRAFDGERDYPARQEIHNASFPDRPVSEQELRNWDSRENPDPKYLNVRLVAEVDGEPGAGDSGRAVAYLWYGHRPGLYHPRKLHFSLTVHPAHRRRGIGGRLYGRMLAGTSAHDPIQLMAGTLENQPEGLEFLGRRGFEEHMRAWESFLDVAGFDSGRYADAADRPNVEGIDIRSEAELASDPQFERKLYDLLLEVLVDVPAPDPVTPPSFERFLESRKNEINRLPDAFFVAIDPRSGEYVGTSSLWKLHAADYLNTGLTGVRRAYRRRGIALALKLTAIAHAKRIGAPRIRTDNEAGNQGMLNINETLGFERGTAEVVLVKRLRSDERQ